LGEVGSKLIRTNADRTDWGNVEEKEVKVVTVKTIGFSGNVTLTEWKVKDPLYIQDERGRAVGVAADGYKWLQLFPDYANYTVTSVYDENGQPVLRIVSICKGQGVTADRIPWYDDLYLQMMILPGAQPYMIHQELLEEAVQRGELDVNDYELAWRTARHVMDECLKGSFDLLLVADMHLCNLIEN